jgi:predicted transposase YdaD
MLSLFQIVGFHHQKLSESVFRSETHSGGVMHHYDIAAKVLIDTCRDEILRRFLKLDVSRSTLIENLPQETVSVKRSDFPMQVIDSKGMQTLVILEIQTRWLPQVPLNLLDYRIRHILASELPAVSAVLLLKPDARATDHYQDNEVIFQYRLIKLFEMDALEAIKTWPTCLLPFVPLMKNGPELTPEAEQLIYDDAIPSHRRADMLTSMTILSGLVSDRLPIEILSRRRDLMIESAAYDLIKQEGFQLGIKEGIQQGIEQGNKQGQLSASRDALIDLLTERFDIVPQHLVQSIQQIENLFILKMALKQAIKAPSLEEFEQMLNRLVQ